MYFLVDEVSNAAGKKPCLTEHSVRALRGCFISAERDEEDALTEETVVAHQPLEKNRYKARTEVVAGGQRRKCSFCASFTHDARKCDRLKAFGTPLEHNDGDGLALALLVCATLTF
jgi:hypothetical protein